MAKSKILMRRGPKKPVSKSEAEKLAIDIKAFGPDEPVIPKTPLVGAEYISALTWYNRMADWFFDPKDWVVEWLTEQGRTDEAKRMKRVPDKRVVPTLSSMCRLLSRGAVLVDHEESIEKYISQCFRHENDVVEEEGEEKEEEKIDKPTIQERTKEKTSDIIGELEGIIDDCFPGDFKLESWYREKNVKPQTIKAIVEKLRPVLEELREARKGKDDQLREAYRHMTKDDLDDWITIYESLIEDSERFALNAKQAKPARKTKVPSIEKKLKFLMDSYQKHSKDFNITSIDPGKIIGAQELWVFNTKYKLLTVFRAQSHGGQLDVNRCKIVGFDPNASTSKSIGRKTSDWITKVMGGTRASLKKIMDEVPSNAIGLQERINENVILLKAW